MKRNYWFGLFLILGACQPIQNLSENANSEEETAPPIDHPGNARLPYNGGLPNGGDSLDLAPQCTDQDYTSNIPKFPLRRLTNRELDRVLSDLLGKKLTLTVDLELPIDGAYKTFSQIPENLGLHDIDQYMALVDKAVENFMSSSWINLCSNPQGTYNSCTQQIASEFMARAFRHPIESNLVLSTLTQIRNGLSSSTVANAQGHTETLKGLARHVFLSPEFLFLYEDRDANGKTKDWALASRISFFFMGSIPDEALWSDVEEGKVRLNFEQHLNRLLNNNQVIDTLAYEFGGQWLGALNGTTELADANLVKALNRESILVMRDFIADEIDARKLLNPGFTYANQTVAQNYGLKGSYYANFTKVRSLQRGGMLAMGGFLSKMKARPTSRGAKILSEILCRPLGAPTGIDISDLEQKSTLRDTLAQLWEKPTCQSCHFLADPLGFGIEKYGSVGEVVSLNTHGDPVDTSGWIGSETFKTTEELIGLLEKHPAFPACIVEKMYSYANTRILSKTDSCRISKAKDEFARHNYSLKALIKDILLSDEFQGKAN